jgi:hypothetical protein
MKITFAAMLCSLSLSPSAAHAEEVTLQPVQDAFVCDCMPNTTNPMLGVQYLAQGRYSACYNRSLMQWDLSSIPAGSTIVSATLERYCCAFYGSPSGQMAFYVLTGAWDEDTVTHNNMPPYSGSGAVFTSNWPSASTWHSVDVTGFVTAWYSGSQQNYGLYCHSTGCTGTSDCAFYSSNVGSPTYRPRLRIVYTPPTSLDETSWGGIKTTGD